MKYIKLDGNALTNITELLKRHFSVNERDKISCIECRSLAEKILSSLPTIETSEDAISRATALEIYSDLYWIDERLLNFKSELDKVYDELRNAPSVIPKPKEGEWLLDGRCSNCLQAPLTTHKNFCPNCGTKMKGGR